MNPILFSDDPVLYADYLMYDFSKREKPEKLFIETDYDENSGLSLMKRKTPLKKSVLFENIVENVPLTLHKEYFKIANVPVDTVRCNAILVNMDFEIVSEVIPFELVIVCELRDSTGAKIQYETLDMDQMHPVWNATTNKIHHSLMLSPVQRNPASFLIYFWNKRKVEYRILQGRSVVSSLR